MIVITRQDDTRFIAQAYRERLPALSKRLMAQEIKMLSSQHGAHVCLIRQSRTEYDVIFSQESGFLLGELIWDYFGCPEHLIYCEALSDSAHCLLVIIRNGAVYLDKKVLSADIQKELMPILADSYRYDVYTHGDLPLRDVETFGGATFMLPKVMLNTFNHLKKPIFPKLLPSPYFELKSLSDVLRSKYLRRHSKKVVVTMVSVFALVLGWWSFSAKQDTLPTAAPTAYVNLSRYDTALATPSPRLLLSEIATKLSTFYALPGWEAAHINYSNHQFDIQMKSHGGSFWYLTDWAKRHNYQLRVLADGAQLQVPSHISDRLAPKKAVVIQASLDLFLKRMAKVLANDAVHINATRRHGSVNETQMTLDLRALSPDLLDLIGHEFDDLPISLSSINMHFRNGLIDGKIRLSLWGR